LWRVFHILTEPVPYTLVSVNRRNDNANIAIARPNPLPAPLQKHSLGGCTIHILPSNCHRRGHIVSPRHNIFTFHTKNEETSRFHGLYWDDYNTDRFYLCLWFFLKKYFNIISLVWNSVLLTAALNTHSTTPTPTSSRGSSRGCQRVVQLATGITSIARVGR